MTEQAFWEIINRSLEQNAPGSDGQYIAISQSLANLPPEQLIGFENQLSRQKAKAFSFPVLMANFILQSYINDDIFEDFRLWLISFGEEKFTQILHNPDVLADLSDITDPVEDITGEGLVFAALEAYEAQTGRDDFLKQTTPAEEIEMYYDWPDHLSGLEARMPKLFARYWDSNRSYELAAE
ncbi:DUF4240 domain-containing protein [Oceanospirillum beijerinckii]|uniref:DUF4240 domain-containing protein n=1 Tax=Oceanospirillum beijerinckii TaxID=64976 RepID=UPI00041DF6E9|nr:DUF4240 domain-containing protein [Oceanospirillum beijerinckii]MAC45847.1 DUF4240 domain-containing protein [Oceanospirillum sp.]